LLLSPNQQKNQRKKPLQNKKQLLLPLPRQLPRNPRLTKQHQHVPMETKFALMPLQDNAKPMEPPFAQFQPLQPVLKETKYALMPLQDNAKLTEPLSAHLLPLPLHQHVPKETKYALMPLLDNAKPMELPYAQLLHLRIRPSEEDDYKCLKNSYVL
jgi:hypothetical protein